MTPSKFHALYAAGRVARYHTADVPPQSLADHSWGVALIVATILPTASGALFKAALTHDLAESITGDLPATVKWDNPDLLAALRRVESVFDQYYETDFTLTTDERKVLEWADMFELCLYCAHQENLGNRYANAIKHKGLKHIVEELGFPTTQAKYLFFEHFGHEGYDYE